MTGCIGVTGLRSMFLCVASLVCACVLAMYGRVLRNISMGSGDGAVISTLSTAETENVSLRVAIEELQTSVSEQHATCVGQVEAWFLDAEQDTTSLVQALELGESLPEEDTEAEESRSLSILAMSEEASDLSAQCSGAQANATNILVDLDGHIALLPAEAKATDNAMGTAAETMEKLCSQAPKGTR